MAKAALERVSQALKRSKILEIVGCQGRYWPPLILPDSTTGTGLAGGGAEI